MAKFKFSPRTLAALALTGVCSLSSSLAQANPNTTSLLDKYSVYPVTTNLTLNALTLKNTTSKDGKTIAKGLFQITTDPELMAQQITYAQQDPLFLANYKNSSAAAEGLVTLQKITELIKRNPELQTKFYPDASRTLMFMLQKKELTYSQFITYVAYSLLRLNENYRIENDTYSAPAITELSNLISLCYNYQQQVTRWALVEQNLPVMHTLCSMQLLWNDFALNSSDYLQSIALLGVILKNVEQHQSQPLSPEMKKRTNLLLNTLKRQTPAYQVSFKPGTPKYQQFKEQNQNTIFLLKQFGITITPDKSDEKKS
ncbi:hypothetical protein [Psittacicella hinzii]|uniref:Uncharacterized protein n=1 Tax=Psittacicella hinzii TaxID=2028575 RepID=A0A3A1YR18_9GAMM|nr:hypothetical protein [Psittacicella hinzii]RIY39679.1 hypothetical protein CKF58_01660 [Psittacicella hinzii]